MIRTATSRTSPGAVSAAKPVSSVHGRLMLSEETCTKRTKTWLQTKASRCCAVALCCMRWCNSQTQLSVSTLDAANAVLTEQRLCSGPVHIRASRCCTTVRAGKALRAMKPRTSSAATIMMRGCGMTIKSCAQASR